MYRRTLIKHKADFGSAAASGTLAAPYVCSAESRKVTFANVETIGGNAKILEDGEKAHTESTAADVEINTRTLDQVWVNVRASLRSGKPIDITQEMELELKRGCSTFYKVGYLHV